MTDFSDIVKAFSSSVFSRESGDYEEVDADAASLPDFKIPKGVQKAGKSRYGVRIVTGKQEGGGTSDRGVYIIIVGSKGSSGKVYLTGSLSWFTGKGTRSCSYDDLVIECSGDLGQIEVVELGNDKGLWSTGSNLLGAAWYVDFVVVHNFQQKGQQGQEYPCYHWIGDGDYVTCTANTTTMRDVKESKVLMHHRQRQVERRQEKYKWHIETDPAMQWGLPSLIEANRNYVALPFDEQFSTTKAIDFTSDALKAAAALGYTTLSGTADDISFYDYLFKQIREPPVKKSIYEAGRWTSDVEFGRQILNGVNPVIVQRCDAMPPNFPVTNDMVKGSMCRELSLEEEMKAGRVYIVDMKVMHGLKCKEGAFGCAPLCLLYVNTADQLVPVAIQLKQDPGEDNPVFLPSDNWIDWLVAKMYFNSTFGQLHQMSTHYLCCHAAMEAYSVATMRTLPDAHPLFKLLRPAFRYTCAINVNARLTLINPGGIIDQVWAIGGEGRQELVKRACGVYRVQLTNIKHSMESRGVGDADKLPNYYYRDDGVKVWEALESYARGILDLFYKCDADVKDDCEVQKWAAEVHSNAFPAYSHKAQFADKASPFVPTEFTAPQGRGFPKSIDSLDELVEYCTLIMFTGSVQHSAVNFGQFENLAFVPNCPLSLAKPPPIKKGEMSYQDLMSCLPNKLVSFLHVATTSILSQHSPDEIYLNQFTRERFTEKETVDEIKKFLAKLDDISTDIHVRNKPLDIKYEWLLPGNISQSITI